MNKRKGIKLAAAAFALAISFLSSSCLLFVEMDLEPVESFVPQPTAKILLERPSQVQAEHPCPCFLASEGIEAPLRPLENQKVKREKWVKNEEELLNAAMMFVKPYFTVGSDLRPLYNSAIETLNTIIRDGMSDFEKVHAIYDFLVYYVDYDFELYELYQRDKSQVYGTEKAFKLKGVFLDRKAVCDGISKAFSLMCSIECIPNVRVVGLKNGVPHAWNKVRLGGKWYLVDATWGNYAVRFSEGDGNAYTEYLIHTFLCTTDDGSYKEEKVFSAGLYSLEQVRAREDYGFYAKSHIPGYLVLGKPQDYVIESITEFLGFLSFISDRQLSAAEFYSEIEEAQLDSLNPYYKIVALEHDKNVKLAIKVFEKRLLIF